ncbi:MAG: hypothetical protein HXM13_05125 [Fusobacterium periodonticum]|nr:hypothetical protein [Fusobacterium periodonticum]
MEKMDNLVYQTKQKIENIKSWIKEEVDLKEINKKFFNTQKKKKDFLKTNYIYFTDEELKYLDFEIPQKKGVSEEIPKINTENKGVSEEISKVTKENTEVSTNLLSNYFKEKANVETLIKMIEDYKNKDIKILDPDEIEIPSEVLRLKNNGNINVKANAEQYQRIRELAVKNNVAIANFMNFVLWEFLKKFDK